MASLNNNLSELDTLLQDLNNARYTGVFKEPAASTNGTVNGSRPTVDSLLDALDDVDTGEVAEHRTVHHEIRSSTTQQPQRYSASSSASLPLASHRQEPSASSATKELDDLMASLSDFKVKEEPQATSHVVQVVEVVHHKPQQPQSGPPHQAATMAEGGGENAGGGRTLTVRHDHTHSPLPEPRPPLATGSSSPPDRAHGSGMSIPYLVLAS